MRIDFLFRLPEFPLICDVDGFLITATSAEMFESRLDQVELKPGSHYYAIDSIANEWEFYADKLYIVPTGKRKWSKKKIVQMYNGSKNRRSLGIEYSERSLSSKRFEQVFADIVELIERLQ